MKNIYLFILIFSTYSFISCSKSDSEDDVYTTQFISENSFPDSILLKPVEADDINEHLLYPNVIHIFDSTLVVIEKNIDDEFIKFFSTSDFSPVGNFGSRGEGPNEYSNILHHVVQIRDIPGVATSNIFDWQNKRITSLKNVISNQTITANYPEYILPPELMLAQRATFLNDSTVIGMGGLSEGILFWADIKTDSVSYLPFFFKKNENLSYHEIADLYRGEFAVDKEKKRIVLTTKRFPQFFLLDLNGNLEKVIQYDVDDDPIIKSEYDRKLYFKDIKISDKYIYLTYLNLSSEEMEYIYKNYKEVKGEKIYTEIHVFNWDGEPIRKLLLEDVFVQFIEIDEKHNRIFAIDTFSEKLPLVYFESEFIR